MFLIYYWITHRQPDEAPTIVLSTPNPQPTATIESATVEPSPKILLTDKFDGNKLSSQWTNLYDFPPVVSNGLISPISNDWFVIQSGVNSGWTNYIVYVTVIVKECVDKNPRNNSRIGVRYNGSSSVLAYTWSSCKIPPGKLSVVITVQGDQFKTEINGVEDSLRDISDSSPGSGGIEFEVFDGSAIDEVLVVSLP